MAETPVVDTPVVQDAQTPVVEDKTLTGGAEEIVKTPEEIAAEAKKALESVETPEAKIVREAKEASDKAAKTVPEKYELKLPEGFNVDQTSLDALTPVFKELGLTNDAVNKLAIAYAPQIKAQIDLQQKTVIDAWTKETDGWKADSVKELGVDAPKELAFAAKVINRFGSKYKNADGTDGNKLRDMLDETRVGNHPEFTRLLIGIGKVMSQDAFVESRNNNSAPGGFRSIYDHPDSKALT